MAKAGYVGNQPVRVARSFSYPGAWNGNEQFAEQKGNAWPEATPLISYSIRLGGASNFSRTFPSAGNRRTWTWAAWIKRSIVDTNQSIFAAYTSASENAYIRFTSGNFIDIYSRDASGTQLQLIAGQPSIDVGAWMHIAVAVDTTQAVAADRVKLYINGQQFTAFSTATLPAQNAQLAFNTNALHSIGDLAQSTQYFQGYITDVHFVDGFARDITDFGFFDGTTDEWMPKQYISTFGANGFRLGFANISTPTNAGLDSSGNNNNWTPNNIFTSARPEPVYTSINDTFNPALNAFDNSFSTFFGGQSATLTFPTPITGTTFRIYIGGFQSGGAYAWTGFAINGLTPASLPTAGVIGWFDFSSHIGGALSTISVTSITSATSPFPSYRQEIYAIEVDGQLLLAKQFNEASVDVPVSFVPSRLIDTRTRGNYATLNSIRRVTANDSTGNGNTSFSVSNGPYLSTIGMSSGKWYCEVLHTGTSANCRVGLASSFIAIPVNTNTYIGDTILGWAYLASGSKRTGGSTSSYGSSWGAGVTIGIAYDADNGTLTFYRNGVSQGTAFTGITGGPFHFAVSPDAAGFAFSGFVNFGQFPWTYAPPSGHVGLVDTNLTAPSITRPSDAFQTLLWTGNGTSQTITGLNFSPDFVWIKARNSIESHAMYDIVRGAQNRLASNESVVEATSDSGLTAFNSNGFSLGTLSRVNSNATNYVGWCWDTGSLNIVNAQGSISSISRANTNAGTSIVTYTGTGASATVGHGLGRAPAMIMIKARNLMANWVVYNNSYIATLNFSAAATISTIDIAAVGSTTFTLGSTSTTTNSPNNTYVAYCFASTPGYSAFGYYTGNGNANGPFVPLSFRPRWIMVKNASGSGSWYIADLARSGSTTGSFSQFLFPASAASETSNRLIAPASNGFTVLTSISDFNQAGSNYLYAAFAEFPLQFARAI